MKSWRDWGERIVRFGLGGIFVLAGVLKVDSPQAFADGVNAYRLLPALLINPVALGLPIFEIVVGLGLVVGWRQRLLSGIATGVLVIFTLALLQAQLRHLEIDCACFGPAIAAERIVPPLPRDALLVLAAVFLYRRARTREAD